MYFVTFPFLLSPEWLEAGMCACPGGCAEFWVNESLLLSDLPVLRSIWQQRKLCPGPVSLRRNTQGFQFHQTRLFVVTGTRLAHLVRSSSDQWDKELFDCSCFHKLQWRIVPRTHLQATLAPSLLREGTDCVMLIKEEFALSLSSKMGWVMRGREWTLLFPFPIGPRPVILNHG